MLEYLSIKLAQGIGLVLVIASIVVEQKAILSLFVH